MKRLFDVVLALFLSVLLAIPMSAVGLAVLFTSPGPMSQRSLLLSIPFNEMLLFLPK